MVIRSPWAPFHAGAILLFALGVLGLVLASKHPAERLVSALVAVLLLAIAVRATLASVVMTERALVVRGVLRSRRVARAEIASVRAHVIEVKVVPVWAPVLTVTPHGRDIPLRCLSGYSSGTESVNRRVARNVDQIDAWLASAP